MSRHGLLFSEGTGTDEKDLRRSFGFDATKFSEHEFEPVGFNLARVQESLFGGTYRNPVTLRFSKEAQRGLELSTDIELHVRLAQAFYVGEPDDLYRFERPEWYLRGVGHFRGPTGELETATTIVHLVMADEGQIGTAVVQVLVDPVRLQYIT